MKDKERCCFRRVICRTSWIFPNQTRSAFFCTSPMFQTCAEACACDRTPHMPKPVDSTYAWNIFSILDVKPEFVYFRSYLCCMSKYLNVSTARKWFFIQIHSSLFNKILSSLDQEIILSLRYLRFFISKEFFNFKIYDVTMSITIYMVQWVFDNMSWITIS